MSAVAGGHARRASGGPFWPWSARSAVLAVPLTIAVLLVVVGLARTAGGWPGEDAERTVLIGVLLLAFVPLILLLLGSLVGGGSVAAFGVSIRFPETARATPEVQVPSRLGLEPGMTLNDNTTTQILDTLNAATHSDVAVLDLEEGAAWWETRLLVLCAGASRMGRPRAIVFVATVGGVPQVFLGWAPPTELLRRLLGARDDLRVAFDRAAALHRQWDLALPPPAGPPGSPPPAPPVLPFTPPAPEASGSQWVEFPDGHRNPLAAEQLLALELGGIENQRDQGTVSAPRLAELFTPVLRTDHIDLDEAPDSDGWARRTLALRDDYAAMTHGRVYAGMVSRDQVVSDVLGALLEAPRTDGS